MSNGSVCTAWILGRLNFWAQCYMHRISKKKFIRERYFLIIHTQTQTHRHQSMCTLKEAGKWSPLIRFHVKIKPLLLFCSARCCVVFCCVLLFLLIRKWICKSVSILCKNLNLMLQQWHANKSTKFNYTWHTYTRDCWRCRNFTCGCG